MKRKMTRKTTLGNAEAQKLRCLQDAVEALPDPSTVWKWSDGLDVVGPSQLSSLEDIDAIEQVGRSRDGWWRVTPRVSDWMRRVHNVEPSGTRGQETLPTGRIIPGFDTRESSVCTRRRGRQVTLTGDPVTRDLHSDNGNERRPPSDWPGQLDVFEAIRLTRGS